MGGQCLGHDYAGPHQYRADHHSNDDDEIIMAVIAKFLEVAA